MKRLYYEFEGQLMTAKEIAGILGVSKDYVRQRYKKGLPFTDPKRSRTFGVDGKQYTLLELSELSGINISTIKGRLRRGLTAKEAINMPASLRGRKEKGIVMNDRIMRAWRQGEATIAEVMEKTGYTREKINYYLPVDALEADEYRQKKEVLRKYGY